MIEVKKIVPQVVEHFDPYGNSLGYLNELECLDLRVQIAKNKISGYYLVFEDTNYYIESTGQFEDFPADVYRQPMELVCELFKIQKENKSK